MRRLSSALVHRGPARSSSLDVTEEFCCLVVGFPTRCATCPLPRAVQDLFMDGTLPPKSTFGRRAAWNRPPASPAAHRSSNASYDASLAALGLQERPRRLSEIKRAFRARAKELHPDTGGSADAFRALIDAFELAQKLFVVASPPPPPRPSP